jgi:hypothetical protein
MTTYCFSASLRDFVWQEMLNACNYICVITVGKPSVTIFPPDEDTEIPSTDGGPVPVVLPPPLIGGGDTPYDVTATIDTKPGETFKPGDTVTLPPGNNTVTYTAKDGAGNSTSTNFVITVCMCGVRIMHYNPADDCPLPR